MISIIIPAYNDEKYIARCLDSIVIQNYKDYEVLLVLDGSTDGTKNIANNYIGRVNKLRIIEQNNAGAGSARNNGIEHSSGDFIVFVDADDWLEPNALQTLIEIEENTNADYIIANAITVEQKDESEPKKRFIGHETDCFVQGDAVSRKFLELDVDSSSHSPWGKLFKTQIIKENNIRFPDLRRSQDIVFNNVYARYINSIYVSSTYIYNFWNTIYSAKVYKDKLNRRNSPRFIEAEKNHLLTMSKVVGSFYETMRLREYKMTDAELQMKRDSYLIGIYNNIAANANRKRSNAYYALNTYGDGEYFKKAIDSPKNVMLAYKILAFFLRLHLYGVAISYVKFCEFLNDTRKRLSK